MTKTTTVRGRTARRFAFAAVTAAALTGAIATPAFAAKSQGYSSMSECRAAQVATGATSFVRITKSCYDYFPQIVGGVWSLDPSYRFEYVTR